MWEATHEVVTETVKTHVEEKEQFNTVKSISLNVLPGLYSTAGNMNSDLDGHIIECVT